MKKMTRFVVAILVVATLGGAQQAAALPMGATLIDAAGLQWLSPTYSQGITYNQMLVNLMTAGNDFYGLRLATQTEVNQLAEAYGFPTITSSFTASPSEGVIDSVINDFGITWSEDFGHYYLGGYIAENYSATETYYASFFDFDPPYFLTDGYKNDDFYSMDYAEFRLGSWLVQEETPPVPEPSTMLLFGIGLAGFAWYRRRKK